MNELTEEIKKSIEEVALNFDISKIDQSILEAEPHIGVVTEQKENSLIVHSLRDSVDLICKPQEFISLEIDLLNKELNFVSNGFNDVKQVAKFLGNNLIPLGTYIILYDFDEGSHWTFWDDFQNYSELVNYYNEEIHFKIFAGDFLCHHGKYSSAVVSILESLKLGFKLDSLRLEVYQKDQHLHSVFC